MLVHRQSRQRSWCHAPSGGPTHPWGCSPQTIESLKPQNSKAHCKKPLDRQREPFSGLAANFPTGVLARTSPRLKSHKRLGTMACTCGRSGAAVTCAGFKCGCAVCLQCARDSHGDTLVASATEASSLVSAPRPKPRAYCVACQDKMAIDSADLPGGSGDPFHTTRHARCGALGSNCEVHTRVPMQTLRSTGVLPSPAECGTPIA